MRKLLYLIPFGLIAAVPLATQSIGSHTDCPVRALSLVGEYPDHAMSPRESVRAFDTVFYAEVVVPSRQCSLGQCAGVRVLRTIKGRPGSSVLLRIAAAADQDAQRCLAPLFAEKGSRWVVFANQGTSKGGQRYFDMREDGPSFAASEAPDFDKLEMKYKLVRARLDQAIEHRMGRWR
jgi:hypothetical protein